MIALRSLGLAGKCSPMRCPSLWSQTQFSRALATKASANVSFPRADGKEVPGIVYGEPGSRGIVLIQEWWGVDFAIKAHAEFLAGKGFRVVIPDLYRGEIGVEAEEAQHLMGHLDWLGAISDISAASRFLRSDGSGRVAGVGFCMGGALTIATAVHHPNAFECICPFYGVPPATLADVRKLSTPLLYHSGANDAMAGFSSPVEAAALEAQVTAPKQIVVVGAPFSRSIVSFVLGF